MEEVAYRLHQEVASLMHRLDRECARRDRIEDRLGKALLDVGTQVERLYGAYHQASVVMTAIGMNPFDHCTDFSERRLSDLVSFFSSLLKTLGASVPS